MVLPRASSLRSVFRRSTLKASGPRVRSRLNQHVGSRTYASEHGSQKASSDLPWLIGSIAVTVPSATWLWQQGPKKGEGHSHGHEDHAEHADGEEHEEAGAEGSEHEGEEKPEEDAGDEKKDAGDDEDKKEEADSEKVESADEAKGKDAKGDSEESGSEGDDDKDKDTPPTSDNEDAGEGSDGSSGGTPSSTEKKGEKDAQGDHSGAKNPYIDDPEKSKKGEGITETAKIHGTVDTNRDKR